jgi:hypothetical protein
MAALRRHSYVVTVAGLAATLLSGGCMTDSRTQILATPDNLPKLRQIQSRIYQTSDQAACFRAVIATLQIMQYGIDKADETVGLITATSLHNENRHFTVTITPDGANATRIRVNGERYLGAVTDPAAYQSFYDSLGQMLSLKAFAAD